jgi:hypothetical protein
MILISSKRIGFSGDSGLRWGSTQKPVAAVWSRAKGFPAVDRQRSSGQFQKAHFYFFRQQPFKKPACQSAIDTWRLQRCRKCLPDNRH